MLFFLSYLYEMYIHKCFEILHIQTNSLKVFFLFCFVLNNMWYISRKAVILLLFQQSTVGGWNSVIALVLTSHKNTFMNQEDEIWGKEPFTKSKSFNVDCEDLLYNPLVIQQNCCSILVGKTYRGTLLTPCPSSHPHFPWIEYVPAASEDSLYGFAKDNASIPDQIKFIFHE